MESCNGFVTVSVKPNIGSKLGVGVTFSAWSLLVAVVPGPPDSYKILPPQSLPETLRNASEAKLSLSSQKRRELRVLTPLIGKPRGKKLNM